MDYDKMAAQFERDAMSLARSLDNMGFTVSEIEKAVEVAKDIAVKTQYSFGSACNVVLDAIIRTSVNSAKEYLNAIKP